jgi:hypothetical protein
LKLEKSFSSFKEGLSSKQLVGEKKNDYSLYKKYSRMLTFQTRKIGKWGRGNSFLGE